MHVKGRQRIKGNHLQKALTTWNLPLQPKSAIPRCLPTRTTAMAGSPPLPTATGLPRSISMTNWIALHRLSLTIPLWTGAKSDRWYIIAYREERNIEKSDSIIR